MHLICNTGVRTRGSRMSVRHLSFFRKKRKKYVYWRGDHDLQPGTLYRPKAVARRCRSGRPLKVAMMKKQEPGVEQSQPATESERRSTRFSGSLIRGSLYVFLCLGVMMTGLGLGIAYNPVLLILSTVALVALVGYLAYVLFRRKPWKKHGLGPPLFSSSRGKVSASNAGANSAADEAIDTAVSCNYLPASRNQDIEAISSKTYIVVK